MLSGRGYTWITMKLVQFVVVIFNKVNMLLLMLVECNLESQVTPSCFFFNTGSACLNQSTTSITVALPLNSGLVLLVDLKPHCPHSYLCPPLVTYWRHSSKNAYLSQRVTKTSESTKSYDRFETRINPRFEFR